AKGAQRNRPAQVRILGPARDDLKMQIQPRGESREYVSPVHFTALTRSQTAQKCGEYEFAIKILSHAPDATGWHQSQGSLASVYARQGGPCGHRDHGPHLEGFAAAFWGNGRSVNYRGRLPRSHGRASQKWHHGWYIVDRARPPAHGP